MIGSDRREKRRETVIIMSKRISGVATCSLRPRKYFSELFRAMSMNIASGKRKEERQLLL